MNLPAPERHDTYGGHDALWMETRCGQPDHPTWWSCSVCAERPEDHPQKEGTS